MTSPRYSLQRGLLGITRWSPSSYHSHIPHWWGFHWESLWDMSIPSSRNEPAGAFTYRPVHELPTLFLLLYRARPTRACNGLDGLQGEWDIMGMTHSTTGKTHEYGPHFEQIAFIICIIYLIIMWVCGEFCVPSQQGHPFSYINSSLQFCLKISISFQCFIHLLAYILSLRKQNFILNDGFTK